MTTFLALKSFGMMSKRRGSPEDRRILILVVRVERDRAEMWDGPASSAVAALEFAKARLTHKKPNLGEKRKVTAEMEEIPKTHRG